MHYRIICGPVSTRAPLVRAILMMEFPGVLEEIELYLLEYLKSTYSTLLKSLKSWYKEKFYNSKQYKNDKFVTPIND